MKSQKQNKPPYWASRFLGQISPELPKMPAPALVKTERKQPCAQKVPLPRNALKETDAKYRLGMKSILVQWVKNYCQSTTLHGFKYMTEPDSRILQRIVWFFALVAMFFGAIYVVFNQTTKFLQSPTLISFAHEQTPVTTIPFPALTLCPHVQLKRSYYNMSWAIANRNNFTAEQQHLFHLIIDWCGMFKMPTKGKKYLYKTEEFHYFAKAINSYESCLEFLPFLTWAGFHTVGACEIAQPVTTEFGGCFAFNMLPLDQILRNPNTTLIQESWATKFLGRNQIWSPDMGFTVREDGIPLDERTPPWSPRDGGIFNFLSVVMNTNRTSYDPVCTHGGLGFIGFIHNPAELPHYGQTYFYADEGKVLWLEIQPKLYTLDPRLEAWSPNERGCYLQNERYLSFYTVYTQKNCESECAANFSLTKCGCAAHYHPRLRDTAVCGPEKTWCFSFSDETAEDLSCDCKPACSDLEYTQTASAAIHKDWPQHVIDFEHNPKDFAYSMLYVKFHGRFVQAIRRDVMFGKIDFIANTGGLLGLFLGFSLLSLVELVYFITYKFWCLVKERLMEEKH